jgi:integrase
MAVIQERPSKKKGSKPSYRVLIRTKEHTETRTFHDKKVAERWAHEIEDAYRSGKGPALVAGRETLEQCIDAFERNPTHTHLKSHKRVVSMLREWEAIFISKGVWLGDLPIASITTAMIDGIREQMLAKPVSPATVNRKVSALSVLYGSLALKGIINPINKSLPLYNESRGRVRYLSDDERGRLFAACRTPEVACAMLYPLVVIACYSGMRRGEILQLTWEDITMSNGQAQATLHDTKNGDSRAAAIVGPALEALMEWRGKVPAIGNVRVFPNKVFPQHAWERALIVAGIKGFRFHDLRHSFASYLAMNSASLSEIAEALGHRSFAMVKRYAHLSPAHTLGVVERMTERRR